MIEEIVLIIPVYNPDEKFIDFLEELTTDGWKDIIIVDDGSKPECQHYFHTAVNQYGCQLVKHNVNLGQGRAFKSAFNYLIGKYGGANAIGVVECDCDGQHVVEDVNRCAELLKNNPDKFILGVRNFNDKSIPFRSRFGNKCTSMVFKLFCGMDISDTQTGLKGIPTDFVYKLIEVPGERFEYASSVLLETKKQGVEILQYPIQTIYINGNETSHFNPLLDSIRIYSLLLKFLFSSLSAFIVDILMFSVFLTVTKGLIPDYYIIVSTYLAKLVSCTYSFVVNKRLVFRSKDEKLPTALRFLVLCVIQSSLSGFLTDDLVGWLQWNEVLSKMAVDTILFFMSFQMQNRWVFGRNASKN